MQIIKISWRNVWRRKRRTWITAFSIGFGVFLATFAIGVALDSYANMINSSAAAGYGHVTVEPQGYNVAPALDKRVNNVNVLREQLIRVPGIDAALVRIMGQAMFATASKTIGGAFLAIDPENETDEYNLIIRSFSKGKKFSSKNASGIIIGERMAERLNLTLGKKLVYTTTDMHGEIVSEVARVTGMFNTGVDEMDGHMVLLPLGQVQKILGYKSDEATMITLLLHDQRQAIQIRDSLRKEFANDKNEILSWQQTQPDLAGLITFDFASNYIMQILIALLIAAGILNTLLMSVLERTREFGVMMAIGMTPSRLFSLVMAESVWIAIIGLIVGVIISIPLYWYLSVHGWDISSMLGGEDYTVSGVLVDPVIRIRLYQDTVWTILAFVFGLSMLSGIYPAWRAGRVPPIESLRNI